MPQIDEIKEAKANELFRDCALFAGQFFELPMPLAVGMENYTEQRFHHSLTPSFTNCDHGNIMIVFNRDWVYDRIDNHYDDVQFFMLHELRHANQFVQIMQLEQGEATQEPPQTIKAWMTSFGNYTHMSQRAKTDKTARHCQKGFTHKEKPDRMITRSGRGTGQANNARSLANAIGA